MLNIQFTLFTIGKLITYTNSCQSVFSEKYSVVQRKMLILFANYNCIILNYKKKTFKYLTMIKYAFLIFILCIIFMYISYE